MKNCNYKEMAAHLYPFGMLSGREKELFEKHLETCDECNIIVNEAGTIKDVFGEAAVFCPPMDMKERILLNVKESGTGKPEVKGYILTMRRFSKVAVAALFMLAMVTTFSLLDRTEQPKETSSNGLMVEWTSQPEDVPAAVRELTHKAKDLRTLLKPSVADAAEIETWADNVRNEMGFSQASLQIVDSDGKATSNCPLKHTDVAVNITGFIARVTVTQEYHNPLDTKIEAVYVFPLSHNSAVDEMSMVVGDRRIVGKMKERDEARRMYEQAVAAGNVASLLEQERPNIFTQSVANIMPGEKVTIVISYVEFLDYRAGNYELVFPMVVGPRYIPGSPSGQSGTGWSQDTNMVKDGSRITPQVASEGMRAGHDISINAHIDAGFEIRDVRSILHEVYMSKSKPGIIDISLKNDGEIPNRDFILRYKTAGGQIESTLLTHAEKGDDGFFTLIVQPPEKVTTKNTIPKEMIFVIDTSGSMSGWPIEKAKETMKYSINNMNLDDTFQLVSFSNNPVPLFDKPQPNTMENREKALRFLGGQMGNGGTEMLSAVHAVLKNPAADPERVRVVCFMTDGFVGNDMDIIKNLKQYIGTTRFFSFGVGNSVNRFLLDEMARMGHGEVEYVTLNDSGEEAAKRFHDRIANPVLTDIKIDWKNLNVKDVYPLQIPDLYDRKPLVITGRYSKGGAKGSVQITGMAAHRKFQSEIKVEFPATATDNDVLGKLWAKTLISELMRGNYSSIQNREPGEIKDEITRLGLEYRIMTQYTSFVAVAENKVTPGGTPATVPVITEMPDGVSHRGVFGEENEAVTVTGKLSGTFLSALSNTPKVEDKLTVAFADIPANKVDWQALKTKSVNGTPSAPNETRNYEISRSLKGRAVPDTNDSSSDDSADIMFEPRLISNKISPALKTLVYKILKDADSNGNLKNSELEVKEWKTYVKLTTKTALDNNQLDRLKRDGFMKIDLSKEKCTGIGNSKGKGNSEFGNFVYGIVDVRNIHLLADYAFVSEIEKAECTTVEKPHRMKILVH